MDTPASERISCLWLWPHHINQTASQIIDAEVQWNVLCIQDNEMLNFPDSFLPLLPMLCLSNFYFCFTHAARRPEFSVQDALKEEIANFWIKNGANLEREDGDECLGGRRA